MTKSLKSLLAADELVVAPGAYDALTAKLIEHAGFNSVYMSGYCTAATTLGMPDVGLLTMTEMIANLRAICNATELPVISDGDTGYGNALNVHRTVREYEQAGAAALHIEDQVWPKRCGHMAGKQVIAAAEMSAKVKAAVDARRSEDFVVIARTDALAVEGLQSAVDRCHAYAEAGADVVFVDGQASLEDVEAVPRQCPGLACLINLGPLTPNMPLADIKRLGYAITIIPGICLAPAVIAIRDSLGRLRDTGSAPEGDKQEFLQFWQAFNQLLEVPRYLEMSEKYDS